MLYFYKAVNNAIKITYFNVKRVNLKFKISETLL